MLVGNVQYLAKMTLWKKVPTSFSETHSFNHREPNLGVYVLEVLTHLFTRYTQPRISSGFRAINTQNDLGQTP